MTKLNKVWELHKSIYRHLKMKAKSLEGSVSKEFIQYEKNQRKYASREFTEATMENLFSAIEKSHVVYLGDFHSFDQNTRNLERMTRTLIEQKQTFSLGVEFVPREYQYAIDYYLQGMISEFEFLEEIRYHESWRFPWIYYRPFFQMARDNNVPVLALNSEGPLSSRDKVASEIIKDFYTDNENARLLVLFGELHIVKNKLPHFVKNHLDKIVTDYTDTIIHQNLDEVYWNLEQVNIEKNNQIVKFDDHEFVLLSAPPWIKYESMIYWYENLSDVAEAEINEHILNEGVLYLNSNVPENFLFLCEKIHETLDLQDRINKEELEDFNIYEHQKLDIVLDKIHNLPRKNLIKFFERLVSEGRVFRIPGTSSYYCSSYSINRMGQLAGFHLKYLINQKNEFSDESIWFKSKTYEKFISIVKINTIGFLASKIINPYRKCDLYLDVVKQLAKLDKKFVQKRNALELFKSVVEIEDREKLSDILRPYSLFTCHESARKLGFYLGEILYEQYLVKNRNDELLKFMNYFFEMERSEENFQSILRELLPSDQYILHQKRYF